MADSLVDGQLRQFDEMMQSETGAGPMQAIEALGTGEMEPVDQFLASSGALGEDTKAGMSAAGAAMALTALGDLLSNIRTDALDERWAQDENTLLNFAFKNGHHYVEADKGRRGIVATPLPRNHVRRKIHKFEPWYRAQHGALSALQPTASVNPATKQQTDRDSSKFANEVYEWMAPQAYSFPQRSQATMWMILGGVCTAYVDVEWEPDPVYQELTGFQHKPNLVFEYLSPMEMWTNNRASSVRDMQWIGRDRFLSLAQAREQYMNIEQQQQMVRESEATDPQEHGFWTLRQVQSLLGREDPWGQGNANDSGSNRAAEEEEVIFCEFWGKRGFVLTAAFLEGLADVENSNLTLEVLQDSSETGEALVRFPNGLRVVFSPEGFIFEMADNHTPGGELPFREMKLSQSAGYWSPAWATPLRELNQMFDWVFSMREEVLLRTASPTFLEPKEARISRRVTASGTTMRVRYQANRFGAKPEWANPPTLAADTIEFIRELNELWMEIGGRREVSQGALPARLSGVAVSLLQEADAAQLGFGGNELEEAYSDIVKKGLLLVQRYFPEEDPRLEQLAGDAPYRMNAFMQADIQEDLDLQVVKGSGMPRSASAVKQQALELFQAGALIDPVTRMPDVRRLLKVFDLGTDDELYGEEELDRQNAMEEEDLILSLDDETAAILLQEAVTTGVLMEPFGVSSYDNHVVHERSHRMRLKKIEGDQRISPIAKKLLEIHWTIQLQGALPILAITDPVVAGPFLQAMQGGEEEGSEEGGSEEESVS